MPTLANHANLSPAQAHRLVDELRPLSSLDEVLEWGRSQPTPRSILEILVQDDSCHDLVMEWERGIHLVFDTSCTGGLRNVSVWDYRPSPEEILQMRQSSGWKPSSASGGDGSELRGHAPCVVTRLEI